MIAAGAVAIWTSGGMGPDWTRLHTVGVGLAIYIALCAGAAIVTYSRSKWGAPIPAKTAVENDAAESDNEIAKLRRLTNGISASVMTMQMYLAVKEGASDVDELLLEAEKLTDALCAHYESNGNTGSESYMAPQEKARVESLWQSTLSKVNSVYSQFVGSSNLNPNTTPGDKTLYELASKIIRDENQQRYYVKLLDKKRALDECGPRLRAAIKTARSDAVTDILSRGSVTVRELAQRTSKRPPA